MHDILDFREKEPEKKAAEDSDELTDFAEYLTQMTIEDHEEVKEQPILEFFRPAIENHERQQLKKQIKAPKVDKKATSKRES